MFESSPAGVVPALRLARLVRWTWPIADTSTRPLRLAP